MLVRSSSLFTVWTPCWNKQRKSLKSYRFRLPDGAGRGSNLGPKVGSLLGNRSRDTGSLHLTLGVHDHTSVI